MSIHLKDLISLKARGNDDFSASPLDPQRHEAKNSGVTLQSPYHKTSRPKPAEVENLGALSAKRLNKNFATELLFSGDASSEANTNLYAYLGSNSFAGDDQQFALSRHAATFGCSCFSCSLQYGLGGNALSDDLTERILGERTNSSYSLNSPWSIGNTFTQEGWLSSPVITYGFANDGSTIAKTSGRGGKSAPSNLNAWAANLAELFDVYEVLHEVYEAWDFYTGIRFEFLDLDDGSVVGDGGYGTSSRADIRIGAKKIDGTGGTLAYNYFPAYGGDMVLDSNDDILANRDNLFTIAAHEAGHGIGLNHDDNDWSLMAPYFDQSSAGYGPQLDDVAGAQVLYGDNYEDIIGNDTFDTATLIQLDSDPVAFGSVLESDRLLGDEVILSLHSEDIDFYKITFTQASTLQLSSTGTFRINPDQLNIYYFEVDQSGTNNFSDAASQFLNFSVYDSGEALVDENVTKFDFLSGETYYIKVQENTTTSEPPGPEEPPSGDGTTYNLLSFINDGSDTLVRRRGPRLSATFETDESYLGINQFAPDDIINVGSSDLETSQSFTTAFSAVKGVDIYSIEGIITHTYFLVQDQEITDRTLIYASVNPDGSWDRELGNDEFIAGVRGTDFDDVLDSFV